jgi:hypothetical protein
MPAEPAGRSNELIALPEGWRFKSSLRAKDVKIEVLDPRELRKGVAFVNPRGDAASIVRLTGITVASDRRSPGLGGKLLRQVEMELASLGFQSVETAPTAEVRGFCQKAGYRPDAGILAGTWSKPLLNPQASGVPVPARIRGARETKLAGGVYGRLNGQIALRSSRFEAVLPPGYQFRPLSDLEHLGGAGSHPGYTTISGHGSPSPQAVKAAGRSPLTTVPSGTRVVVLTPPGTSLSAGL